MGTVTMQASMSLDGYIADPDRVFRVSAASADYLRSARADIRAGVIGRPPVGEAVFVVTHRPPTDWDFPDAPFSFVTDDLVPVVFGAGVRYFGDYAGSPLLLEDPRVVQGERVMHLRYRLRRS